MFCPKCGKETPENQAFCASCGAPLAKAEARQEASAAGGRDFAQVQAGNQLCSPGFLGILALTGSTLGRLELRVVMLVLTIVGMGPLWFVLVGFFIPRHRVGIWQSDRLHIRSCGQDEGQSGPSDREVVGRVIPG